MRGDPATVPHYPELFAQLHGRIHACPANQLGSLKVRLETNISRTTLLDEPRKQILLSRLANMPEGDRLCHGDFHPMNVSGQASQPIVIDWPDACRGDPTADVCWSYLLLKLYAEEIAEPYLDACHRINNVPRWKILDWAAVRRGGQAGGRRSG